MSSEIYNKCSTKKMHGILLKPKETYEKFVIL